MPSFTLPLLSPKNKTKLTKSKTPIPPATTSTEPGEATASTAATAHKQEPTANACQPPPSSDAIQISKKVKTGKGKRLLSSPLSKHKSTSLVNVEAQNINKTSSNAKIPRMHRDMRTICDEFRISEQSRLALRKYDATRLEDFCYMTDEDYATMIDVHEREGCTIPPLQQRKIRVLLMWARSLTSNANSTAAIVEENANIVGATTATGNTAISPGGMDGETNCTPLTRRTASAASGIIVPSDWEKRFYADLPSLKEELKKMGGEPQLPSWLSSLRMFCGFA